MSTQVPKWIGVDFDETLRRYDGTPIQPMVDRVRRWLEEGRLVRIVTARLAPREFHADDDAWLARNGGSDQTKFVQDWLEEQGLPRLPVQWGKSSGMIEIWDDKNVRVQPNTGLRESPSKVESDTEYDNLGWKRVRKVVRRQDGEIGCLCGSCWICSGGSL